MAEEKKKFEVGKPIKQRTNFKWDKKGPVRHFLLTIEPYDPQNPSHWDNKPENKLEPKSLIFRAVPQHEPGQYPSVDSLQDMKDYVETISKSSIRLTDPTTPYDIKTRVPCWVIFELDPKINWQFSSEVPACSTKFQEPFYTTQDGYDRYGHNYALHHVYTDTGAEDPEDDKTPPRPGCRMIFFGLVHRNPYEMPGMNLMVEFYQNKVNGEPTHVIPVIIDPDVGNDGPNEFPSPP